MANENVCVFYGQKVSSFRSTTVQCGATVQTACKACEKELRNLEDLERCRRALIRGIADRPERLRDRITLITEAESHRPKCLRCGTNMTFMKMQELDNSPMRDSIFKEPFEVLPAYCESCGKFEFYNPSIIRNNKFLAYLIAKDTNDYVYSLKGNKNV